VLMFTWLPSFTHVCRLSQGLASLLRRHCLSERNSIIRLREDAFARMNYEIYYVIDDAAGQLVSSSSRCEAFYTQCIALCDTRAFLLCRSCH